MTVIVNELETIDKSNLEVIRIEFAKLQKKLEECQKDQEFVKPDIGKSGDCGQWFKYWILPANDNICFLFFSPQATVITQES